jgi:hypothetical protein
MCKFICRLFKRKEQSKPVPPPPTPTPTPPVNQEFYYYYATQYLNCLQNSAPGQYVIRTRLLPVSWICGDDDLQYQITGTASESDYNNSQYQIDGDLLIDSCSGTCA